MALNNLQVTQALNQGRIKLHGDMSVAFNEAVTSAFAITFFTTTTDQFTFTTAFKFMNLDGQQVNTMQFGGQTGMSIELMFDTNALVWYIISTNSISQVAPASRQLVSIYPWEVNTPSAIALDTEFLSDLVAAVATAPSGAKRLAGANFIASDLGTTRRLYIYRDDVLIIPATYASSSTVISIDGRVYVDLGIPDTASPIIAGDLSTGVWRFELSGGSNYTRIMTGTVGALNSGSTIELSANPSPGVGFTTAIRLLLPVSLES